MYNIKKIVGNLKDTALLLFSALFLACLIIRFREADTYRN